MSERLDKAHEQAGQAAEAEKAGDPKGAVAAIDQALWHMHAERERLIEAMRHAETGGPVCEAIHFVDTPGSKGYVTCERRKGHRTSEDESEREHEGRSGGVPVRWR